MYVRSIGSLRKFVRIFARSLRRGTEREKKRGSIVYIDFVVDLCGHILVCSFVRLVSRLASCLRKNMEQLNELLLSTYYVFIISGKERTRPRPLKRCARGIYSDQTCCSKVVCPVRWNGEFELEDQKRSGWPVTIGLGYDNDCGERKSASNAAWSRKHQVGNITCNRPKHLQAESAVPMCGCTISKPNERT